jgi:hypothetical protein
MFKHEVCIRYCNGKQEWTFFDHAPQLGATVRVQGSPAYGEVIAVGPNLKKPEQYSVSSGRISSSINS